MNVATTWSPPPDLFHFMLTADKRENGRLGFVHAAFAYFLLTASEELRMNAPSHQVALEAARSTVGLWKSKAERGWAATGHTVEWIDDDYEAIAQQMADELPRHPIVAAVVERAIGERLERIIDDVSLTHNDELFVVYVAKFPIGLFDETIDEIKEQPIVTVNRWLDHTEDLMKSKSAKLFIPLRRNLLAIRKVHDLVLGD